MKSKIMAISVPAEFVEFLKKRAKEKNMRVSQYIRYCVMKDMNSKEDK